MRVLFLLPLLARNFTQSFGRGGQIAAGSYHSGGHAMARKGHITRYTDSELAKLAEQEGTLSDWGKTASMTEAEIEARVASDSDEDEMVVDWAKATIEMPQSKAVLNMRVDKEVLDYFRKGGKGYQSRINAVLRSYVELREYLQHQKG
jgi:uncharacterized protein (DUF4415 family)